MSLIRRAGELFKRSVDLFLFSRFKRSLQFYEMGFVLSLLQWSELITLLRKTCTALVHQTFLAPYAGEVILNGILKCVFCMP